MTIAAFSVHYGPFSSIKLMNAEMVSIFYCFPINVFVLYISKLDLRIEFNYTKCHSLQKIYVRVVITMLYSQGITCVQDIKTFTQKITEK